MWNARGKGKRPDDALSSYNSLRDPHLKPFFRRPQIRKHLIKANIINKDNKIVDEIMKIKHLQQLEHEKRKALYQLLKEITKRQTQEIDPDSFDYTNHTETAESNDITTDFTSLHNQDELLRQAQVVINRYQSNPSKYKDSQSKERESLLKRLDRMIKLIQSDSMKSGIGSSKSYHEISTKGRMESTLRNSHSSTTELNKVSFRPKSSYGRQRLKKYVDTNSQPNLSDLNLDEDKEEFIKTKSINNLTGEENEIESLDGESFTESDQFENEVVNSMPSSRSLYINNKQFNKQSYSHQQVKVTLRFSSLNTGNVLSQKAKRNVKIFQQLVPGGNSIIIFDRYVVPGELITFNVRPHPKNSFAIIILVNGIRDMQINTCCEHKHKRGTRLSQFTIVDVVGSRPCLACQNYQSIDGLNLKNSPDILDASFALSKAKPALKHDIKKANIWSKAEEKLINVQRTSFNEEKLVDYMNELTSKNSPSNQRYDPHTSILNNEKSSPSKFTIEKYKFISNDSNKFSNKLPDSSADTNQSDVHDTNNSIQFVDEHDQEEDNLQEFIAIEKRLQDEEEIEQDEEEEASSRSNTSENNTVRLIEVEATEIHQEKNENTQTNIQPKLLRSESMSTDYSEFDSIVDETIPNLKQMDSDSE